MKGKAATVTTRVLMDAHFTAVPSRAQLGRFGFVVPLVSVHVC